MGVHPDPDLSRKYRRQRLLLLVVVNGLVLSIALVASVDLRRLRTPGGTALRWVESAVFGDCDDYLRYSVVDPALPETRSRDELCRDLREGTREARANSASIGLNLGAVTRHTNDATVAVTLTRQGKAAHVDVHLVRRDGRWRVLRDPATCASVGCA